MPRVWDREERQRLYNEIASLSDDQALGIHYVLNHTKHLLAANAGETTGPSLRGKSLSKTRGASLNSATQTNVSTLEYAWLHT